MCLRNIFESHCIGCTIGRPLCYSLDVMAGASRCTCAYRYAVVRRYQRGLRCRRKWYNYYYWCVEAMMALFACFSALSSSPANWMNSACLSRTFSAYSVDERARCASQCQPLFVLMLHATPRLHATGIIEYHVRKKYRLASSSRSIV